MTTDPSGRCFHIVVRRCDINFNKGLSILIIVIVPLSFLDTTEGLFCNLKTGVHY